MRRKGKKEEEKLNRPGRNEDILKKHCIFQSCYKIIEAEDSLVVWMRLTPHRLIYLSTLFPVNRTVGERLGSIALLEKGVSLGVGFEVLNSSASLLSAMIVMDSHLSGVALKNTLPSISCLGHGVLAQQSRHS